MRALRGCLLITLTLLLSPSAMAQSVATGTIAGFGGTGYRLAVEAALSLLEESKE